MQIRFSLPLILLLAVFAVSCSKKNKEGKYIPKDAAVAVHINGASLSAKLPWEEIKGTELFKEISTDSNITGFVKQVLENPENSGIDIKTDMVFFLKKDSLGGYAAFCGTVKDAEKFKSFNQSLAEKGVESEKDGIKFISKPEVCIGWNKEKFVYVTNMPDINPGKYIIGNGGNSSYKEGNRDINKTCKEVFNIEEDASLGKDEKFSELVKTTGDLHFWINSEELNKNGAAASGLKMLNIDMEKLYKGSVTTATVNFENGQVLIDTKNYAGKEITELWKKYSGKVDESMLKRIAAKDVAAVIALNFKPEGIKELVKLMGVEGYANMGLAFMGFTLDDFVKANKGDVVLAVTDFKTALPDSVPSGMVESSLLSSKPTVVFGTSVGDKDAFNKLIKAGEKLGKDVPSGTAEQVTYNNNGSYFAIGNSKDAVDKFVSGGNNNFDFISKISGQSFGGYFNIGYILKSFANESSRDSSAKAVYDASVAFWDNVYLKGGDYNDGGTTSHIEVNLVDKSTNSLKQLNKYISTMGLIAKKEKEKERASSLLDAGEFKADTVVPVPPVAVPSK